MGCLRASAEGDAVVRRRDTRNSAGSTWTCLAAISRATRYASFCAQPPNPARSAFMPFWNKNRSQDAPPRDAAAALAATVRSQIPDADDATVRVVTAVAGLLAAVAYADRVFDPAEVAYVRESIGRINGITPAAQSTICGVLGSHLAELSSVHAHAFTRDLKQLTGRDMRLEILDVLVDLAAADGVIVLREVNQLRQITTSLGLTQDDYNASQARHLDKLEALKK
jgi:uncharacterized tellurite resistance protein B-like protein